MNFFQAKRPSRKTIRMNPIIIPRIIQISFQHLNYIDLLKCRYVCKLWNEEATKRLQDLVIVHLNDWHSIEKFNRVFSSHDKVSKFPLFKAVRLGKNLNLVDTNLQISLGKFASGIKELVVNTKIGSPEWRFLLVEQFVNLNELRIYGPAPFQPIISGRDVSTDGKMSKLKTPVASPGSKKSQNLPNLTLLSFNLTNKKTEDIFVRRFLRDLFSLTPNLEVLEWIKEDPFLNDFQKTMFDCLMNKTKDGFMTKLKVFRCPSLTCGTKELKDILTKGFPLKEIEVQISQEVSAHYLEHFLESLGKTLELLKLNFCPGTPLNIMVASPYTNLVHLTEITLTEYRRSIGFVGYLPCIRKLTLIRTNIKRALLSIGWSFDSQDQTELSKSLESLYIYNDYLSREQGNCTREIVLKLAHCFPNLRIIRLEGLDDSSVRHLLKGFNNLQELYAPMGTYSDEAFRSYTDKDQYANVNVGLASNRYVLSAFDATHLKNFTALEVESIGLGDKFITHGIIHWKSLRSLTIKYARISFQTLTRLLFELDLHRLRLQYCTVLTDRVLEVLDDPVEMIHDDDSLDLSHDMIQKWRFGSFRMLFVQVP